MLIGIVLSIANSVAQDSVSYNKIYVQTYLEIAPKDFNRALAIADSLYLSSTKPIYKARSLMLSAALFQQNGNIKQAIEFAEKANGVIQETTDYNWQVRIYGFLATQYRSMKIYSQSKVYSDKALHIIPKIGNQDVANTARGLMHQELAYYYIDKNDYRKSIQNLNESLKYFKQSNKETSVLRANNQQLIGLSYYLSQEFDASIIHYQKGLGLMKSYPASFITGLIYNGIAAVYIKRVDYKEAKAYMDSATAIAKESKYLPLQNEVLKTSEDYYTKINDIKNLEIVRREQDSIHTLILDTASSFMDAHLLKLETKSQSISDASSTKTVLIIAVIVLLLLSIFYSLYYRIKKRRQVERFRIIIKKLRTRKLQQGPSYVTDPDILAQAITDGVLNRDRDTIAKIDLNRKDEPFNVEVSMMPAETREKLSQALSKFEETNIFINRNLSLSFLATHLNTNTKYLSHIINTEKGKDFNNYINELRINYIIRQLNDNPSWRRYKISVIAEEAGFSSHKKFSTIFKSVVGIPPSIFIQYLEEGQNE